MAEVITLRLLPFSCVPLLAVTPNLDSDDSSCTDAFDVFEGREEDFPEHACTWQSFDVIRALPELVNETEGWVILVLREWVPVTTVATGALPVAVPATAAEEEEMVLLTADPVREEPQPCLKRTAFFDCAALNREAAVDGVAIRPPAAKAAALMRGLGQIEGFSCADGGFFRVVVLSLFEGFEDAFRDEVS